MANRRHELDQRRRTWQQHAPLAKPANRKVEQRPRTIARRPRPIIQPGHQVRFAGWERDVAVPRGDLPLVLQPCLHPIGVPLHARRISHPDLTSDVVDHPDRDIQRIGQERADMTHRDQLQCEPEPVVVAAPLRDDNPVGIIEEEEPLQHLTFGICTVPPVASQLLIAQQSRRHDKQRTTEPPSAEPTP